MGVSVDRDTIGSEETHLRIVGTVLALKWSTFKIKNELQFGALTE